MLLKKWLILIVFFIIFSCGDSKIAPDYIRICPGLKPECLKKTIKDTIPHFVKGLPSLGINVTDPLYKNVIEWELPGKIKVKMTDAVMTGVKNCVIDSVMFKGLDFYLNTTCKLFLETKYKATGQILIFTLNGDGLAKIKSPSVTLNFTAKFEDRTRNGVTYREIKSYKVAYNYTEKVEFIITNLFKGNPEISQAILKFINDNWQVMVQEFGKPLIEALINIFLETVKKFFNSVPRDELFIL